jgi:hypothetical protein
LKFLQEKEKDHTERAGRQKYDSEDLESKSPVTELTPLRSVTPKSATEKLTNQNELDGLDFFSLLEEELNKINKFYSSKLIGESSALSPLMDCILELRVRVEEVVEKWKTTHQSHHSNLTLSYLTELKDVYLQLTNLLSFAELNRTGRVPFLSLQLNISYPSYL